MDFLSVFDSLGDSLKLLGAIFSYWWLFLPPLLVVLAWELFRLERNTNYFYSLKWVLLEVRIPKDPHRSPKAAEQIFSGLHGTFIPPTKLQRIFKGKTLDWFSFEVISTEGKIGFFVRAPEHYRNLVEAQIYAQYPEVEIVLAEDYIDKLPRILPDQTYETWGAEFALTKEDAYPIRTYEEFEDRSAIGKEDIRRVDPMASLSEILSGIHSKEHIWIQFLIRPTGDDWVKRAQQTIDKLSGKEVKPASAGGLAKMVDRIDQLIPGGAPPKPKDDKEKKPEMKPGAGEAIKAIEKSTNKLGHETTIRFVVIGPRDNFHRAHISGVVGFFKQFSTQNLNGFKLSGSSMPIAKWPFKKKKELRKKKILFRKYRERRFSSKPFVFNTEELATVFHFPDVAVKSHLLPRIESKKGEPPTNLPIVNLSDQNDQ